MATKKTGFTDWGTSPCKVRLVNAVSARNRFLPACLAKRLSGRGDAVGEYHWDLQPIFGEMSGWQKQLPPPLSLEVGQTPQVEVVMECDSGCGPGCFSRRKLIVSSVISAMASSEQALLRAPL